MRVGHAVLLAGLLVLLLSGCGSATAGERVTVAAASDLAGALEALAPLVERECGAQMDVVLGSSGQLRDQVRAGAPYDLYLSADRSYPYDLEASGDIQVGSVHDYAVGHLALPWRDGLAPLMSIQDLARPDVQRIAIANPDHAPYGRAAREALESAGLWESLSPRLVVAENVRQAAEYVRSGDADAGLVALSTLTLGRALRHAVVDPALHALIVQAGGVVASAEHGAAAECVLRLLQHDDNARSVLRASGFETVD